MSSQIQITGETKVKSLTGVLVGTSGVVSSLNIDGSLGIPQLDVNGKILVSQLPNSVMEYKGTWDASTNTPTLANGTGNQGDVYLCSVAGTVNFGAGPISFVVSDQVIYSGSIWQKASGTSGTVTSVAASITGNSLGITGSPITTAGTLAFAFAGTNLQYVNGAGNLTTFPTLLSSVGLSMPSAFSVSNSPLTSNGTIAVTGAGYPSQYIRGDGTLADFPTSGGGGSSVSYYLNGGTSQGSIGGVTYYQMSKTAVTSSGVDFAKSGDGLIVSFLTDAGDPAQLNIPAGNWNLEIYASMSSNGGTPELYAELYKYDGTTFTLISTSSNEILYDGVNLNLYTFAMTVPATTLALTDRLAIKLYSTNSGGKTTTVHTQDSHLCQIITTFSTGITALNGLTAQVQYFATGTSGTDFNISSSTATHTFNIPDASASARGLITTGSQTIAGAKTFNNGLNLRTGFYPVPTAGDTGLASSGSGLSILLKSGASVYTNNLQFSNASNDYTFPNSTGTIALTSNLSSYVPYTGATANVDLGNFTFNAGSVTAIGTIRGLNFVSEGFPASNIAGKISLYQTGNVSTNTGYTDLASPTSSQFGIYMGAGKNIILDSSLLSTQRTYNFPNAAGTIVLLESTQTFSGVNTFSSNISVSGVTIGKGRQAGTGADNIALGFTSLQSNTTGERNTSIGSGALYSNTTGSDNIALGYQALFLNTTASNNIAMGVNTLGDNTTGINNIGIGISALDRNTTADGNIAIGYGALNLNTTGAYNTTVGYIAGSAITTGSYNTIVGRYIGTATMSNNIVLADGAGNVKYQWDGSSNNFDGNLKSSGALWVNTSAGSPNSMIILAQVAGTQPPTLGNSSIGVNTTDFRFTATTTSTNFKSFSFSTSSLTNNSVRTYSMPDADGTIALTSSLSSYLPLAGGTLTGALNGTSAVFSSTVQASAYRLTGMTGGSGALYWTSDRVTLANYNATGVVNIEANGGTSVATFGGATYNNDFVGTGRFTGIVTFGSTLSNGTYAYTLPSATGTLALTSSLSSYLPLSAGTGNKLTGDLYINKANSALVFQGNTTDALIYNTGSNLLLVDNATGTKGITINVSTGNVGIGSTSNVGKLDINTGGNSNIVISNDSTDTGYNIVSLNGTRTKGSYAGLAGGGSADNNLYLNSGVGVIIQTGASFTEKMRISNAGVVTISALGSGAVTATSGVLSATSDMNLKISDGYIDTALDKILKLTPRYFYWKEETGLPTDLRQLGFYAQEVNEAIGEEGANTPRNENDKWGIYDRAIIAMLTKAMQEQNELIKDLKARLDNAGL